MKIRLRQRQIVRQRQLATTIQPSGRGSAVAEPSPRKFPVDSPGIPTYDDGVVQRCRDQWRRGDWDGLLAVSLDEVERHPLRARIVLMLASAHQALGGHGQTRSLAGLALQWGCDPELVARVLLAGVHNTLGRAAVASGRLRDRALHHFAQAVEPGGSRSGHRLALHARVQEQLRQLQMPQEVGPVFGGSQVPTFPVMPLAATPLRELRDGLRAQARQITQLQDQLSRTIGREVGNAVKQLEAHASLQRYLGETQSVPVLHGWPISADFGVLLLDLFERNDYDLIVEFGSGASTVLMATAVKRKAPRRAAEGHAPAVLLTLEHLEQYHQQTSAMLASAGLSGSVRLALAPICPFTTATGQTYPYYDARAVLSEVVAGLGRPAETLRVLLMVDGPPAATGPRARYPAVPLALEFLQGARIDILLDDYRREDEKQIAQTWMEELAAQGLQPRLTPYTLEKDACLISV